MEPSLRLWNPHTDAGVLRALFVALQDHEHALGREAPRGDAIAEDYLKQMHERVRRYDGVIVMADLDGATVGFVTVLRRVPRSEPDDPVPWHSFVSELSVAPSARSQGIGQVLMARAEQLAREAESPELRLALAGGNDGAGRFYDRLGFRTLATTLAKRLDTVAR